MFNNPYYQMYPQFVQRVQTPETKVTCWFVNSPKELEAIRLDDLFTLHIGINKTTDEIYTRQLTTDGNVESVIYKRAENIPDENKTILDRLTELENKLKGFTDGNSSSNDTSSVTQQSSGDAAVQTNDGRKKHRPANSDVNELRPVERN